MGIPPRRLTLIVRLAVACALFSSAFTVSTKADADQWTEDFKTPFSSQIINVVNGNPVAPTATGAALATITGLHVGDPVLIDGTDGIHRQPFTATIQTITPATRRITWLPALPPGWTAEADLFVRSIYALNFPKQSAIDSAGNVYTTDTQNNRIVAFDNSGRVLWTLGSYGRVYSNAVTGINFDGWDDCSSELEPCPNEPQQMLGRFYNPAGIDVSPDGSTLVVSDQWNDRIQVLTRNDASGAILTTAGSISGVRFNAYAIGTFGATHDFVVAGPGQMYGPSGVSYDAATGKIVVADEQYNNRLQIFTPAGGHAYTATVIGGSGSGQGEFALPEDVEFDRSHNPQTAGRIVVADAGNDRIQVLSPTGQFISAIGDVGAADGVTVDEEGRIYVADLGRSQIKVFRPLDATSYELEDAFGTEQGPVPVPGELQFISPTGVAISRGRLVVTESGGWRLQYLTRSGIAIDSIEVSDHSPLIVQDTAHNHVHVTATVRNRGSVPLTNPSLTITPSYQGTVSPVTSSSTLLEGAGGADTAQYEFDFTVTGGAVDGSGFTKTLVFKLLSAAASAGSVTVTSSLQDFDTGIAIEKPSAAAIALGQIAIGTIKPGRAAIGEQIVLTVPVQNVGDGHLHDVVATVTPDSAVASPSSASDPASGPGVQLAENETRNMQVVFLGASRGTVRFTVHVAAKDDANHTLTADALVPAAPGIQIVADNIAPAVTAIQNPLPHAPSGDGLRWHNVFPTLTVSAVDNAGGVGVTQLHWWMLSTGSQQPTDIAGTCTFGGGSNSQSMCGVIGTGPTAALTWTRNLSPMQGTILIAFWAEDGAGNGVVAQQNQNNCSIVTCVTLHIDVQPPSLQPGLPAFTSDNTAVAIPFSAIDDISHVAAGGITSPNTLQMQSPSTGTLVLTAEGAVVAGSVTVRDNAGNAVSYAVPLAGPGRPVLRLDHTPPEAFNRLDATALGGRCTTTIAGRPVGYFCTNKVYGTDNLPGLTTSAFAPILVIPVRWGGGGDDCDDDDHDWDGGNAEYHVYRFTDEFTPVQEPAPFQNPNQVTLIEKVLQSGNEARVHVLAFQYRQGSQLKPLIIPDWAVKKYEWSTNKDGSLKSLNQKFELHKGKDRVQVEASYDKKSNVTTIKKVGKNASKETRSGLVLLRMSTRAGELSIEY